MRIRTIKPEFYRSADIAGLCLEDRLLFIGIWSYVDDNGVGRDEEDLVVTDLFPKDYFKDPAGTLARVATGLARLAAAGLIVRYEVDGRAYLQVTNWGRHQKIDRPNKPRYPRSDADGAEIATTLASVATNPSWGTEDQGIRGTEDQRKTSVPDAAPPEPEPIREDVEAICEALATHVETMSGKRPRITKTWRKDARLLLDTDGHTLPEALAAISWVTGHSFWGAHILSVGKLREKWVTMRAQAQQPTPGQKAIVGIQSQMDALKFYEGK